jgi:2-polyprenyl-6-methoxyphenol hydroxylase-like FAD-dependent oxidoreductase
MRAGEHRILIAGGGVGGLAAAAALLRHGFEVEIFERAPQITAPSGSGLTIWGNAMKALSMLDLDVTLRMRGAALERQLTMTASGKVLVDLPVGRIQRAVGDAGVGVRRDDLLATLLEAAGRGKLRCGEVLAGMRTEEDCVVAVLGSGEEVTGEILIGADGLRSSVREALLRDGSPEPLRHMVWRGVSDGMGRFPAETSLMVYGPNAVRMVGWPVDDDHVCWSIARNGSPARERRQPASIKRELERAIVGFPDPCRDVLDATPAARIIRTDVFARAEVKQLVRGRVALLGDAGHAMPTVFGQGAAMAIEDAVVLGAALARHRDCLPVALQEYEQARLPRLQQVRGHVLRVSRLQEWQSPPVRAARNTFMRLLPTSVSERMWAELMAFSIDPHLSPADAR